MNDGGLIKIEHDLYNILVQLDAKLTALIQYHQKLQEQIGGVEQTKNAEPPVQQVQPNRPAMDAVEELRLLKRKIALEEQIRQTKREQTTGEPVFNEQDLIDAIPSSEVEQVSDEEPSLGVPPVAPKKQPQAIPVVNGGQPIPAPKSGIIETMRKSLGGGRKKWS